jgi:hypothetical protein
MHGKGTFTWSDGRKYIGEVKNTSPKIQSTLRTKRMDLEFSNGQMAGSTKGNGQMGNKMELELTLMRMETLRWGSGLMGKELDGLKKQPHLVILLKQMPDFMRYFHRKSLKIKHIFLFF